MNVTVIGAGTMGNGIAHVFAQSGHDVVMMDRSVDALDRALATIGKNMDRMVAKEKISAADKDAALGRLTTSTDMAAAVAKANLVVEAATENADLKPKILRTSTQRPLKVASWRRTQARSASRGLQQRLNAPTRSSACTS